MAMWYRTARKTPFCRIRAFWNIGVGFERVTALAFAQYDTSARAKRETSNAEWPIHSNDASSSKITSDGVAPRILSTESRMRFSKGRRVIPLD